MIPSNLSAAEASKKIAEGWISSVDLVQSCLDRIADTDGQIHAWVHVDAEGAVARAAKMDEIRRSGYPTGRLHGIPSRIERYCRYQRHAYPAWHGNI